MPLPSILEEVEDFICSHRFFKKSRCPYADSEQDVFQREYIEYADVLCKENKPEKEEFRDILHYVSKHKNDCFPRVRRKGRFSKMLAHLAILLHLYTHHGPRDVVFTPSEENPNGHTNVKITPKSSPKKSPYFAAPADPGVSRQKRKADSIDQQDPEKRSRQPRESRRLKEKNCKNDNPVKGASKTDDGSRASSGMMPTPAPKVNPSGFLQSETGKIPATRKGVKQTRRRKKGAVGNPGVDTSPMDNPDSPDRRDCEQESAEIPTRKSRGKRCHSPVARSGDSQADSHDIQVPSKSRRTGKGSRAKATPNTTEGFR